MINNLDLTIEKCNKILPYLTVGLFVTLSGLRDTKSFRKIISINGIIKNSWSYPTIFGQKCFLEMKYMPGSTKMFELRKDTLTSVNGISNITGILDEEALKQGFLKYIMKFDKNGDIQ